MICFFVILRANLAGNCLLSFCPHSRCSYWPFARGWRSNYFQGAVVYLHVLRVKLNVNIVAATSNHLSYLHFWSTVVIGFHRDGHLHCLFIWFRHEPSRMIIFDFYLVSIAITSIILYLPEMMKASLIIFCFRKLRMEISSRLAYCHYAFQYLQY